MFLEFAFKALKQCKSIRRTAGKSRDDFAIMQSAHLACITLHHGFTQGHLTITADDYTISTANGKNRRTVHLAVHVLSSVFGIRFLPVENTIQPA